MYEDELRELLALAEQDYPIPEQADEAVRTAFGAVLETRIDGARHDRLHDLSLGDRDTAEIDEQVHEVVVDIEPASLPDDGRARLARSLIRVGAAAVVILGVVWIASMDADSPVVTATPDPTADDAPRTVGAVSEMNDAEVCAELDELAVESGFLGAERAALESVQLERTADLLEEVGRRGILTSDVAEAVTLVRFAALTVEAEAPEAADGVARARSALTVLRLDRLACG